LTKACSIQREKGLLGANVLDACIGYCNCAFAQLCYLCVAVPVSLSSINMSNCSCIMPSTWCMWLVTAHSLLLGSVAASATLPKVPKWHQLCLTACAPAYWDAHGSYSTHPAPGSMVGAFAAQARCSMLLLHAPLIQYLPCLCMSSVLVLVMGWHKPSCIIVFAVKPYLASVGVFVPVFDIQPVCMQCAEA
jgi:hypothetical protein